jgi:cobalt-zinc-cadmium efflux system outer membrane protein
VGSAASEASVAARQSHALQVAGELRELLWHVDELERSVAVAEQAASLSRRRIGVVDRMIEVGELASAEGLLVRREALAQEELLLESRAQLVDAWYLYRSLTGLERRPPALMEPVASLAERSLEEHPTMLLADAERARRAAAAEAAVKAARGQPSIVLGPRSERPFAGAEAADSFGIILSVPFGGGSHVRARSAPAVRAEAAAEAELARVRRALELARHDAEHELEVIRGLLGLSRERRDAATEYARLARTAFQGGELGLRELLRGEASALGAELELIRRESALGLAVARVNGAAGVLP